MSINKVEYTNLSESDRNDIVPRSDMSPGTITVRNDLSLLNTPKSILAQLRIAQLVSFPCVLKFIEIIMNEEEEDFYQINIIHYLNPHLIWVEVLQSSTDQNSSKSHEDFLFEQIGIYGILPLQTNIDVMDMTTKPCISRDWQSTIVQCMAQIIEQATEVRFRPMCIDVKNSIFDNNIHKYGEVILTTKDGKIQNLSSILINKKFAHRNETLFSRELFQFKLNVKLEGSQIKKIIMAIENFYSKKKYPKYLWKKSVKLHTTVFHEACNFENSLTENNVKLHNWVHENSKTVNMNDILVQKRKDFELCKDINKISIGRGDIPQIKNTKMRDAEQLNVKENYKLSNDLHGPEKPAEKFNQSYDEENAEDRHIKCAFNRCPNKGKKKKSKKMNFPNFDSKTEKIVVYGPPDINFTKLCPKVEKINFQDITEALEDSLAINNKYKEMPEEKKSLSGLDSEVNFFNENKYLQKNNMLSNNYNDTNKKKSLEVNKSVRGTDSPDSNLFSEYNHSNSEKRNVLIKKLKIHKNKTLNKSSTTSDSSQKDNCNKKIESVVTNYDSKNNLRGTISKTKFKQKDAFYEFEDKKHVNPFKNVDPTISKFVDNVVGPVLMVHSKDNKRIQPLNKLRDMSFDSNIFAALTDMSIKHPMIIQTVSWLTILRGCSLFMISPLGSGKTLGYTPAVCRLVADFDLTEVCDSLGPICIIVCATTKSVINVEKQCRRFLGQNKTVLACYAGLDEREMTMSLLNGCDIMICTPMIFVKLLKDYDFGVDLRRLSTVVLDDCERLNEVYMSELRYILSKIKEAMKNRSNKEFKIQYIVASRVWCEFFVKLSNHAPKTVICMNSFHECVLYAKVDMSVSIVERENKIASVLDFIKDNDALKRSVIVCNLDSEVEIIAKVLNQHKYIVFTANNTMPLGELYNLCEKWGDYQNPVLGPILVCCDDNLMHMNITNAHYLFHFSMPKLFSMFSRRFAVLIDHYPSIFENIQKTVKIKILLEKNNIEQLPKILNFIKRCTEDAPKTLDSICKNVLTEKDRVKAKNFVPFCNNTLALGECPDFWNCKQRHTLFQSFDESDEWVPKTGIISFRILHYHTAAAYSVRLISNIDNGKINKYPQTYSTLSVKMGRFFSKESNRQLHGIPNIGDVCAVALKQNFFERCQVVQILSRYEKNGNPNLVVVKLIDEEKWEKTRDIYLYYLPDELKSVNSHVVLVKLANIQPKDKDITFSDLSKDQLKKLLDKDDLYMKANILITIGNCLIVDNIEACQDLKSVHETVVRYNIKEELLKSHAILNTEHVLKLLKICERDGLSEINNTQLVEPKRVVKELPEPRWAHLESDDVQLVYFASAVSPEKFFIRLEKFEDCLDILTKNIQRHIESENSVILTYVHKDDLVLAKFPDDSLYYRAKINEIIDSKKVNCFFVDHGDWREVQRKDLVQITESLITRMPFQAIECRLIGLKPGGTNWTEFSTNWLCDQCFEPKIDSSQDILLKRLYAKYFTKSKAECTGGYKYGVVIVDTTTNQDIIINNAMIDLNLARINDDEAIYLKEHDFKRKQLPKSDFEDEKYEFSLDDVPHDYSGFESSADDYDIEMNAEDFKSIFQQQSSNNVLQNIKNNPCLPETLPVKNSIKEQIAVPRSVSSQLSDYEIIKSPKIVQELDSDDLCSPENMKVTFKQIKMNDHNFSEQIIMNDHHFSNCTQSRRPKVYWHQSKTLVSIKIELGAEDYLINIDERSIKFNASVHDIVYSFEIDLYGVIDLKKSTHASKGSYIFVKLTKLFKKTWLSLTKDSGDLLKKWITYDPDSIDTSSDEDNDITHKQETLMKIIKTTHFNDSDDDEEEDDDDFVDDTTFKYRH